MAVTRREFLKQSSAALATAGVVTSRGPLIVPSASLPLPQADATVREMAMLALDSARSAGASYADLYLFTWLIFHPN